MPKQKIITNQNLSYDQNTFLEEKLYNSTKNVIGLGIGITSKVEQIPEFIKADAENVISNANSYIVLGRDRPSGLMSGYGGIGACGAHSIDLVAGRRADPSQKGAKLHVDPSFSNDAARIYISEKTDIDDNFGITKGKMGKAKNISAIGLKADAIRIIGDARGIKLVTNVNNRNSNGDIIAKKCGIELIAGNNDKELQSMVKGENLLSFLEEILKEVNSLNGVVADMLTAQTVFEAGFQALPIIGQIIAPAIAVKQQANIRKISKLITQKTNLASKKINSLTNIGGKYILSEYNKVN